MATARQIDILLERMADREYRHALAEQFTNERLARQFRHLREAEQWTQAELAQRMNKQQAAISKWEDPDYGKYTISTLRELGCAFDVAIMLYAAPFSELARQMVELGPDDLSPASYERERSLQRFSPPLGNIVQFALANNELAEAASEFGHDVDLPVWNVRDFGPTVPQHGRDYAVKNLTDSSGWRLPDEVTRGLAESSAS